MLKNQDGFTLVELAVVVIVIGLVTAIGMANFINLKDNSLRASCISNQKNVVEGTTLYIGENGVAAATINVSVLQPGRYIGNEPSECPYSNDGSFDDYTIDIVGGRVATITCDVKPAEHHWNPPP